MEIIYLLGAILAIVLTALLIVKKNKMLADKLLAVLLLFLGLMLFSYYAEVTGLDNKHPIIAFFAFNYGMLFGAITFVYVRVITRQHQKFKWLYLLHLFPYVFFTLVIYFKLQTHGNPNIVEAIVEIEDTQTPMMLAQTIVNIFLGPTYLIFSLISLRKHGVNILKNFSYTEHINLLWLRNVLLGLCSVWFVVIIMSVISNYYEIIPSRIGDNIMFVGLTLLVFFLGFFGIKQQVIYSSSPKKVSLESKSPQTSIPEQNKTEGKRYVKSGLKREESKDYLQELLNYMKTEKPYLDGKLSLAQIALELDISTNYLSQVINENLNKNFFDFVNLYRVEEVKRLLVEPESKKFTLLTIAYDSGFNSKSSFNTIFKKFTGMTPTQHQKTVQG